jgi:hypothetical protein
MNDYLGNPIMPNIEAKAGLSEADFLAMALLGPSADPFLEASIDAAYQQRLLQILTEWQPTARAN